MSLMSCLEKFFTLSQLVPTPAVAPAFMVLFGISLMYSVRPCGYCMAIMTVLYLCFNPSSPFVTSPETTALPTDPTSASASNISPSVQRLTDPLPNRGWLNWNGGRLFDPPLAGYQLPSTTASASAVTPTRSPEGEGAGQEEKEGDWRGYDDPYRIGARDGADPEADNEMEKMVQERRKREEKEKMGSLPKGYYDFSWGGLGFVIDFGWKRTEEGLRWEGELGREGKSDERGQEREGDEENIKRVKERREGREPMNAQEKQKAKEKGVRTALDDALRGSRDSTAPIEIESASVDAGHSKDQQERQTMEKTKNKGWWNPFRKSEWQLQLEAEEAEEAEREEKRRQEDNKRTAETIKQMMEWVNPEMIGKYLGEAAEIGRVQREVAQREEEERRKKWWKPFVGDF